MDSNIIVGRGHRLSDKYNPIFELTSKQIDMINKVCKPLINDNIKSEFDNYIIYVSSASKSKS